MPLEPFHLTPEQVSLSNDIYQAMGGGHIDVARALVFNAENATPQVITEDVVTVMLGGFPYSNKAMLGKLSFMELCVAAHAPELLREVLTARHPRHVLDRLVDDSGSWMSVLCMVMEDVDTFSFASLVDSATRDVGRNMEFVHDFLEIALEFNEADFGFNAVDQDERLRALVHEAMERRAQRVADIAIATAQMRTPRT